MHVKKLVILVAGDIIESAGTRSYLRELISHLKSLNVDIQLRFFQFRLNAGSLSGYCYIPDFEYPIYIAPIRRLYQLLPRPIYRLFERVVMLNFFRKALRGIKKNDGLVVSGCLGGLHFFRHLVPENTWWLKVGLIEEEKQSYWRFRIRKKIEAQHGLVFSNRIVVSQPMSQFLSSEYGPPAGKELVLPCLVDLEKFPMHPNRDELRRKLQFDGKIVIVYAGTAAPWQCAEEKVQLFELMRERIVNAFMWVLSPDQRYFEKLLQHLPSDCWKVEFQPHSRLAALLSAADVACLLRRRDLINQVASPLKLPEYLACGLPVFIGPEVGQYTDLIRSRQVGAVLDPEVPETWPEAIVKMQKLLRCKDVNKKCRLAAHSLSWGHTKIH